jgi:hypothetical protein
MAILIQSYADHAYTPVPLLLLPSCKNMPAETQRNLVVVWQRFVEQGFLGPLLNMDSDGQSQRHFHSIFPQLQLATWFPNFKNT